jgi:A/G-specific adenine glycosylase
MPGSRLAPFARRLLSWWDDQGRKDLPWQHPRTPYRAWVSEIMLQQTQVATVIPYFEQWMESFPDLSSLAAAPLDEVLSHWAGLGYYARARNLHKAAQRCVEAHSGRVPLDAEALSALPGIGASTANAIVSQSTDRPAVVLDGNVRRWLARHAGIEGWPGKAAVHRQLWEEAESRLPTDRGSDYTQAVMDLGAMICTRSGPRCGECPLNADCEALATGRVSQLPSPKPATKVSDRTVHMLILRDPEGRILLEKRPPTGIWGGLWCLPEGDSLHSVATRLGFSTFEASELPPFEHRLSHVRMTIRPSIAGVSAAAQVQCSSGRDWFDRARQGALGLPKPVSDLLERLHRGEAK